MEEVTPACSKQCCWEEEDNSNCYLKNFGEELIEMFDGRKGKAGEWGIWFQKCIFGGGNRNMPGTTGTMFFSLTTKWRVSIFLLTLRYFNCSISTCLRKFTWNRWERDRWVCCACMIRPFFFSVSSNSSCFSFHFLFNSNCVGLIYKICMLEKQLDLNLGKILKPDTFMSAHLFAFLLINMSFFLLNPGVACLRLFVMILAWELRICRWKLALTWGHYPIYRSWIDKLQAKWKGQMESLSLLHTLLLAVGNETIRAYVSFFTFPTNAGRSFIGGGKRGALSTKTFIQSLFFRLWNPKGKLVFRP